MTRSLLIETHDRAPCVGLMLGVSTARVYALCQSGRLKAICDTDGKWYIERASWQRYKHEIEHRAGAEVPAVAHAS